MRGKRNRTRKKTELLPTAQKPSENSSALKGIKTYQIMT